MYIAFQAELEFSEKFDSNFELILGRFIINRGIKRTMGGISFVI